MADEEHEQSTAYPFETSHLDKGSIIPVDVIELAYSTKYGTDKFRLYLLQATAFVRRQFLNRGVRVTTRTKRGSIIIETDTTQQPINRTRYLGRMKGAANAHGDMLGADRSKIDDPNVLAAHDRNLEVQGRQLQAVRAEARSVSLKAADRQTPGLLGKADESKE